MEHLKVALVRLLRSSERYTHVDMMYLFRGGFLLTGSDALLALVSLGVSVLIAAYVPKETYGIYRYVLSIATVAAAFSLTGMNSAVTRAVALGREGVFAKSLPLQLRYALLQFLVAGGVSGYYLIHGNVVYAIAFASVALIAPLSGVCNTYVAFLNGKKDFEHMALWRIESGLLNAVAMISIILNSPTVIALTLAYVLSNGIANAWFLWRTFRLYRPNMIAHAEDLTYGKHLSIMNAVSTFAGQLDSLLIYHLLGPVSLAVYSFATLIPDRLKSFLSFIPVLAIPRLAQRTHDELRATMPRRVLLALAITGAAAALYAIIAPFFFGIFFPQYSSAVPYTMLAGLALLVGAPKYLMAAFTAKGLQRPLYYLSLWTPVLKVILSVVCILFFGIWGAIAARIATNLFNGIFSYVLFEQAFSKSEHQ